MENLLLERGSSFSFQGKVIYKDGHFWMVIPKGDDNILEKKLSREEAQKAFRVSGLFLEAIRNKSFPSLLYSKEESNLVYKKAMDVLF